MYNGLEVDMLSVGDADCLLVSRWYGYVAKRVLIDGGNASDFANVRAFLERRNVSYLDAVVSTHMHDDHAAGLLTLVRDESIGIGAAYVHIPQNHLQMALVDRALKIAAGAKEAECLEKSLQTAKDLVGALRSRRIPVPIVEPFKGTTIEFLTVAGPSREYYEELVRQFEDIDAFKTMSQRGLHNLIEDSVDDYFVKTGFIEASLLDNPETSAENNSSIIMGTIFDGEKYLFTSDAGVPALTLATAAYDLTGCNWIQIPHHGSRHNITAELIEHLSPKTAFVSAAGNSKHPRRAVVNAFKEAGAQVFSTHYPEPTNLWNHRGVVPAREEYGYVAPLYDKDKKATESDPTMIAIFNALYGTTR